MAQLLSDIYVSFGYISRVVSLQTRDVDYGSIGSAHVVTEVWSNQVKRWIMVDTQFGLTLQNGGVPLNCYELAKLLNGSEEKIQYHLLPSAYEKSESVYKKTISDYKGFIKPYSGSIQIPMIRDNGLQYLMTLGASNHRQYMTFQGLPLNNTMFTNDYNDIYFDVNRVMLFFSYNKTLVWNSAFTRANITSEEYQENLPKVAASPDFTVHVETTSPWLSKIVIKVNNAPEKIIQTSDNCTIKITLKNGLNTVVAYTINECAIAGLKDQLKIFYGTDQEYIEYLSHR